MSDHTYEQVTELTKQIRELASKEPGPSLVMAMDMGAICRLAAKIEATLAEAEIRRLRENYYDSNRQRISNALRNLSDQGAMRCCCRCCRHGA